MTFLLVFACSEPRIRRHESFLSLGIAGMATLSLKIGRAQRQAFGGSEFGWWPMKPRRPKPKHNASLAQKIDLCVDSGAGQPPLTSWQREAHRGPLTKVEQPLKHWELQIHALVIVMISMEYVTSIDLQEATRKLEAYAGWGYYGRWAVASAQVLLQKGLVHVSDLAGALGTCDRDGEDNAGMAATCEDHGSANLR